jgi:hypothetical protein
MKVSGQYHGAATLLPDRASGTHYIGSSVGPTAGLEAAMNRKLSCSHQESNLNSSDTKLLA